MSLAISIEGRQLTTTGLDFTVISGEEGSCTSHGPGPSAIPSGQGSCTWPDPLPPLVVPLVPNIESLDSLPHGSQPHEI